MTVEYRIVDNPDPEQFPDQIFVETWQDGRRVAVSWAHRDIPVESRLNITYPEAVDHRSDVASKGAKAGWVMPSAEVAERLGMDRTELQAAAAAAGLDVSKEAGMRGGLPDGEPSPVSRAGERA